MMRIAYLCSADVLPGCADRRSDAFEADLLLATLVPAFAARGLELLPVVWDDPLPDAVDAVLIGPTWDYAERAEAFMRRLDALNARLPVLNSPDLVRWNLDKRYLRELEAAGVPVVPTHWAERADQAAVAAAAARFGGERLVIKSVVGANAERQVRLPEQAGQPMPPGPVLVQPFLPSIATEGEWSVVCFGHRISHTVRKLPAEGDYRVQSSWGGHEQRAELDPGRREVVARALRALPDLPVYARVDLVTGPDGGACVIEVELIEPYLYPEQGPACGAIFAAATRSALSEAGLARAPGTR